MLKDITVGQYYPVKSRLHTLDPRSKIILVFLYITGIFLVDNLVGYALILLAVTTAITLSNVPIKFMLRGLKSIAFILIFTMGLNMFLIQGEQVIFSIGFLTLTVEGVMVALQMAFRLIMLIIGSSLLTLTTSPIQLTDGIESLLKPLEKIKFPAHEVAMMMSISLRFIPILAEESDKIMKAQTSRGADFETGGIITRAKAMVPILIPLFVSAFMRADELAVAMEARCYRGGSGRSKLNVLNYEKPDYIAITFGIIFLALCIIF